MLASTKRLISALTLVSACTGTIEGVRTDFASDGEDEDSRSTDAGRRTDASRTGTSTTLEPTRVSDGDDDDEDASTDTRNAEGSGLTCAGEEPPHASGLKLREVALYQTVKTSLFKDGNWVKSRSVPVVQGKQALVRAFVDTLPGYARHEVRGVLTLEDASGNTVITDERTIVTSSTDESQDSTFTFAVDGAKIGAATKVSVTLQEVDCDATPGTLANVRVPAQGSEQLGAEPFGKLRIVVVPINISGRLPTTSAAELEKMRAFMLAFYPVSEVEITVRARPLVWPALLRGTDGRGWSTLLSAVVDERRKDAVGSDVYYYGLVQPSATFGAYCATGCILGIAPQTVRVAASMQAALGASFNDNQSYETMVHEIGHAHGRGHAPCARGGTIDGVDGAFPDSTGSTATWGWDSRTSKLLPPSYKDIMGYCQPNWISAYTYAGLAERSRQVNQRAFIQAAPVQTRWQRIIAHGDGSTRWGAGFETDAPGGDPEAATVLDASGQTVAEIEIARVPLADTGDVFLFVPAPGANWQTLVLSDRRIDLSQIEAPL
ncbi:MAG: M66 family metalloprotease [Polyangiales bacterium]